MKKYVVTSARKLAKTSRESRLTNEGYIIEFYDASNPSIKGSIFRSPKQILTDLIGSERLPSTVTDWNNQRVSRAVSRMVGKPFEADITFHKAGDKYLVTAESSVITNQSHPDYGKYKIGDEAIVINDGCRCESFINSRFTDDELDRMDRNDAIVDRMFEQTQQFNNIFAEFGAPEAVPAVEVVEEGESADDELAGAI